jgi:E3 ubiquitin-protein ligase UHRF1
MHLPRAADTTACTRYELLEILVCLDCYSTVLCCFQVVEYWPSKGRAGYVVWRYRLRRDDTAPAPWTEKGKKIIEQKGYTCIFPEGYHEAQAAKLKKKEEEAAKKGVKGGKGKKV